MKLRHSICAGLLLSLVASLSHAGETAIADKNVVMQDVWTRFDKGNIEIQGLTGAYFSFADDDTTLNQSWSTYRIGVMLNDPSGSGILRGNAELMLEISGGKVFNGPGDYVALGGVVARYNFIQPDAKLVPYIQLGAGAVYNDVYEEEGQDLLGREWEAGFSGAVGVRYLIGQKWSIAVEGGYHFITNFGSEDRDHGLHAAGAQIGLTRFF